MRRRNYLDLTPKELLARRYVMWGLGFFAMPPLLTACHTAHYLCQVRWDGDVSPLVTLWALFPWMLSVALVMLGGLGMCVLGGVLFLSATDYSKRATIAPIQASAFRTCGGALIAVLFVGGFGYVVYDAVSPGFYFAPVATERSVWLVSQALVMAVYLAGAALTFSAALRVPNPISTA
jgi:hypothetical protein